jgi:hypothetical protein
MSSSKLIEATDDFVFYCNNCRHEFTFVNSFLPISGLGEYYACLNCNSILPVKDIQKTRKCELKYLFCCFSKRKI